MRKPGTRAVYRWCVPCRALVCVTFHGHFFRSSSFPVDVHCGPQLEFGSQEHLCGFCVFLVSYFLLMVFLGFKLFPNGSLSSIPDRYHYFLNVFWTSTNSTFFGPVVDPWTPYLSWIYFAKYKKISEHPWKIWIWDIWESENLKNFGSPVYRTFRFLKFRNLEIRRFGKLKFW